MFKCVHFKENPRSLKYKFSLKNLLMLQSVLAEVENENLTRRRVFKV